MGSHPQPTCSLPGALEGAAHPAPGTTCWGHGLQGGKEGGRAAHGAWGRRRVTARAGVPPHPLAGSLRQSPTGNRRRQHGPRGNPRRAPRQSVTQWGRPASCPPTPRPGPRGPGCRKPRSLCTDADTGVLQRYSLRDRCPLKAGETGGPAHWVGVQSCLTTAKCSFPMGRSAFKSQSCHQA